MSTYIVVYDLMKQGQNYTDLIKRLESYGIHWHTQQSVWVITTSQSATEVRDYLQAVLDSNDKLVVAKLSGEAAWAGYSANINAWLKNQLEKKAA